MNSNVSHIFELLNWLNAANMELTSN